MAAASEAADRSLLEGASERRSSGGFSLSPSWFCCEVTSRVIVFSRVKSVFYRFLLLLDVFFSAFGLSILSLGLDFCIFFEAS